MCEGGKSISQSRIEIFYFWCLSKRSLDERSDIREFSPRTIPHVASLTRATTVSVAPHNSPLLRWVSLAQSPANNPEREIAVCTALRRNPEAINFFVEIFFDSPPKAQEIRFSWAKV